MVSRLYERMIVLLSKVRHLRSQLTDMRLKLAPLKREVGGLPLLRTHVDISHCFWSMILRRHHWSTPYVGRDSCGCFTQCCLGGPSTR